MCFLRKLQWVNEYYTSLPGIVYLWERHLNILTQDGLLDLENIKNRQFMTKF